MKNLNFIASNSHCIDEISTYKGSANAPAITVVEKGERLHQRFFYITEGTIIFTLPSGKKLVAEKNSIVYLPYDCSYKSCWTNCENCSYIGIKFIIYDRNSEIINLEEEICTIINDKTEKYLYMFEKIHESWISKVEPGFKTMKLFYEILEELKTNDEKQKLKKKHSKIYKAVIYLENHSIENTPVSDLAKMCNMSLTSFRRIFREETGTSPVKYRNRLKMQKAKELLLNGENTVTEIAEALNCTDVYYFSKMFKAEFGVSPGCFKNN
ncbi:MAG: helix-turn-helix transcriptional regulator [Clostridia bacterium]|nr:helix-turn-helix transcriptional regulator [Clostridia bacterium]